MKAIFITGAAAGIGRETALRFARGGWRVGLADRDEAGLRRVQAEIGADRATVHLIDVVDIASVRAALAAFAAAGGGRLDALHNNAGILRVGPFEDITPEDHRRIIDINVTGTINVLHAAFPYLQATPGAVVVNMSSASATYGIPEFASYSATKHAVRALTEALDIEWGRHGIRVCDVMPPFVNTGMVSAQPYRSKIIDRLGVSLEAGDIAKEVWAAVHAPRVHRPVTWPLRAMWPLAQVLPSRVTRELLRRIAGL